MNNTEVISLIKGFMRNEQKAVEEIINAPLSETATLVKILQSCSGKVVFIGVGKSGIIAKKLAATFASTGTPLFLFMEQRLFMAIWAWLPVMMLLF